MESVVEVFIEKVGTTICAKMGQENASKLDFPRIERPSQECETPITAYGKLTAAQSRRRNASK
jgi:hypothetical protein